MNPLNRNNITILTFLDLKAALKFILNNKDGESLAIKTYFTCSFFFIPKCHVTLKVVLAFHGQLITIDHTKKDH